VPFLALSRLYPEIVPLLNEEREEFRSTDEGVSHQA
jgi:hypothetical protein